MGGWTGWLVALGLYALIPLLIGPGTRRFADKLAQRFTERSADPRTRTEGRDEDDNDDEELRLIHRRQKLCADLRRVEHLVATDEFMSATRQLGNRLAYEQLREELRRTPDVAPRSATLRTLDSWDEPAAESRSWGTAGARLPNQPRTVEILDIRWDRPGR